jgi:endo-1,3-1,4-beta-glycanase ExoK
MPAAAYFAKSRAFLAKAAEQISRLARKSPEGTGAVAALILVAVFMPAMSLVGGYLLSPATEAQEEVANRPEPADPDDIDGQSPAARASAAAAIRSSAQEQIGEAFIDRFDEGALDEDRWYVSDGWTNGDWMENDWRRSQVSLTSQGLRLTLGPGPEESDKPFASGEIKTRAEFRYGYFEVRLRAPSSPGLVIGAFTYAAAEGHSRPNEIDIEILGRSTRKAELTIHENGRATSKVVNLPFDAAGGFHTYGVEWRAKDVRWYVDGMLIHEEAGPRAGKLIRPQQFMLSLWASRELDKWVGEFDPSGGPWTLDIACVAYAPAYSGAPLC